MERVYSLSPLSPSSTVKKWEGSEQLGNLPKDTELKRGRGRIHIRESSVLCIVMGTSQGGVAWPGSLLVAL